MTNIGSKKYILSIDPGSHKVGYSVVYEDLTHGEMGIVSPEELENLFNKFFSNIASPILVVGDGTKSDNICEIFQKRFSDGKIFKVNEKNTTFEARKKYFKENPPRGFWKFIPLTMQYPERPIDDYAAWMIGEKYFKELND